jgi:hypothetical protein
LKLQVDTEQVIKKKAMSDRLKIIDPAEIKMLPGKFREAFEI